MIGIRSFILVKQSKVSEIKKNMDKDYHFIIIGTETLTKFVPEAIEIKKAKNLYTIQFPSLGIFASKKVENRKY